MSLETIDRVTASESAAEELIQNAREEVRGIIAAARDESAQLCAEAVKLAAEQAQQMVAEASAQGTQEAKMIFAEADARCLALRLQAESNMGTAVGLIVERVVKG